MAKVLQQAQSADGSKPLKNVKHERFAQLVAKGDPTAVAYSKVWPKAAPQSADTHGPALARKCQFSVRIEYLKEKVGKIAEEKFGLTREKWLDSFLRIAEKAEESEDFMAARGCLREIGLAMSKWYSPAEVEHSGPLEIVIRKM